MTKSELINNYIVSSYNENTNDQLDYFVNSNDLNINSESYLYDHAKDEIINMEIIKIIFRSDNPEYYDELDSDCLLDGEDEYSCDTSAEFILDNDCCLIWFRYKKE